jgi:hypothetical protein
MRMDAVRVPGKSAVVTRIEHVLAPLDGSEQAETALRWLHVLPIRQITLLRVSEIEKARRSAAEDYLANVAGRLCPPQWVIDRRVVTGCPAESIVAAAAATLAVGGACFSAVSPIAWLGTLPRRPCFSAAAHYR